MRRLLELGQTGSNYGCYIDHISFFNMGTLFKISRKQERSNLWSTMLFRGSHKRLLVTCVPAF